LCRSPAAEEAGGQARPVRAAPQGPKGLDAGVANLAPTINAGIASSLSVRERALARS